MFELIWRTSLKVKSAPLNHDIVKYLKSNQCYIFLFHSLPHDENSICESNINLFYYSRMILIISKQLDENMIQGQEESEIYKYLELLLDKTAGHRDSLNSNIYFQALVENLYEMIFVGVEECPNITFNYEEQKISFKYEELIVSRRKIRNLESYRVLVRSFERIANTNNEFCQSELLNRLLSILSSDRENYRNLNVDILLYIDRAFTL